MQVVIFRFLEWPK